MNNLQRLVFIAFAALATPIFAQESSVSFYHKDWATICDNTLTCRTGGPAKEREAGGLLLTRQAGAGATATGEVILADNMENATPVKKLTLWINNKPAGSLTAAENNDWQLSEAQTRAVINAVKGSGKIEFKGGHQPFLLSGEGAYAALLKADDIQGRISTPGAWIKKGNKPESSVGKAVPAPVIQAAKVSQAKPRILTKAEAKALRPQLLATVGSDQNCEYLTLVGEKDVNGNIISGEITATPLDDAHVMLSTQCWGAAYNEGYGYWVTDNQMKAKPVIVTSDAETYRNGVISAIMLGSSAGRCASTDEWVWDGKAFRPALAQINASCWFPSTYSEKSLPTLVTVVKASL